jgi:hypothetical protein
MKLANGRVVLERKPNSPYWFARIRTGDGKWITRTTKQADVAQAGQTALGFLLTPEETGAKVARSSGWADKYSDKADC